ncbi:intraflagellar transport-associated protein-like [Gracilinanus agilis]|uniref:intraflagellar transport-associated protein-like n=1 Tax=Gracilinanus agilis TaxID=191870 RepID=UPI001CFDA1BC|nr:intraflagellar transport-associated protein-like [Gracilinanus agilis]
MSVQLLRLGMMNEDQLTEQALDQFINCPKQTYEEFVNSFTHLSKDHEIIKSQTRGKDSSGNIFANAVSPHDQHIRNMDLTLSFASQPLEEEQIMIDEGQKVGISIQDDLNQARKVKIDNFLDLEDFDMNEETDYELIPEMLLLPGEAEEELSFSASGYMPSFNQHCHPEPKAWPTEQPTYRQVEEVSENKVQPFSLDEEFDYDNVMLTPKFSNAEMKILEMYSQSRLNPDTKAKEPCI